LKEKKIRKARNAEEQTTTRFNEFARVNGAIGI